jgi:low temperature requirement protein LtrA
MRARDPHERHRAATPLELLFDLVFVVAVGFVVSELHEATTAGHAGLGTVRYLMVFFAIWWAWVNFTHFASVYDTDDVPYRLLTVVQIAGVLVLAAGVHSAFEKQDFTVVVIGYIVMRVAMIAQWVRAAVEFPEGRSSSLRFAGGILVCQIGWVLRLFLPESLGLISFVVLVIAELAVPVYAETRGVTTKWHPAHLAERYGSFALIVLGEQVVSSTNAVADGLAEPERLGTMIVIAVSALVTLVGMWWLYFDNVDETALSGVAGALSWSYLHYVILAAIAAVGGGIEVGISYATGEAHIGVTAAGLAFAIPVACYLLGLWVLHGGPVTRKFASPVGALVVMGLGFTPIAFPTIAGVLVALVAFSFVAVRKGSAVPPSEP